MDTKHISKKQRMLILAVIFALASSRPANGEMEDFLDPVGEGIKRIITAPFEIPKSIVQDSRRQNPLTGIVTGTVKGTVRGIGQIGKGTGEVVSAPVSEKSEKKESNLQLNREYTVEEFEPWMDRKDKFDDLENFDPARQ